MRPLTLQNASARMMDGTSEGPGIKQRQERALSEFLDAFYLATDKTTQIGMLAEEPDPTGDERHDALMGAVAEYLSKQNNIGTGPKWAFRLGRYLAQPWHVTTIKTPGMIEYLSWVSPSEFKSRNIYTEERPLRRASQHGKSYA